MKTPYHSKTVRIGLRNATSDVRIVLDALHGSLDWGSGFLDDEALAAAGRLFAELGFACFAEQVYPSGRRVHHDRCELPFGHEGEHGPRDQG